MKRITPKLRLSARKIITILIILWSIAGVIYYGYDTIENELRWSREEPLFTWNLLVAGPLVWLFIAVSVLAMLVIYAIALLAG